MPAIWQEVRRTVSFVRARSIRVSEGLRCSARCSDALQRTGIVGRKNDDALRIPRTP